MLVSRCFETSVKNQLKHQGYSLGVLIKFSNFCQIFNLLEFHSNISWASGEFRGSWELLMVVNKALSSL